MDSLTAAQTTLHRLDKYPLLTDPPTFHGDEMNLDSAPGLRLAEIEHRLAELYDAIDAQEATIRQLREKLEEERSAAMAAEADAEQLRAEKKAAEQAAAEHLAAAEQLRADLEAERAAAETAASEAMLMIDRLQREKSAAQMEARQYRRRAEESAEYDMELQSEIATLNDLASSYHSRLRALGVDPDADDEAIPTETAEEESSPRTNASSGVEKTILTELLPAAAPPAAMTDASSGESSDEGFQLVSAFERDSRKAGHPRPQYAAAGWGQSEKDEDFSDMQVGRATMGGDNNSRGEIVERPMMYSLVDDQPHSVANLMESWMKGGNWRQTDMVAAELGMSLEALRTERESMRQEMAAVNMEKLRLVMLREFALRKYSNKGMNADRKNNNNKLPTLAHNFSAVAIVKWLFSSILWNTQSPKTRQKLYFAGTLVGLLVILERTVGLVRRSRLRFLQGTHS